MTNTETPALNMEQKPTSFCYARAAANVLNMSLNWITRASFPIDFTSPIPESCANIPFWYVPEGLWMQGERVLSKFLRARTDQIRLGSPPTNTISRGEGQTEAGDDHDSNDEGPNKRQ